MWILVDFLPLSPSLPLSLSEHVRVRGGAGPRVRAYHDVVIQAEAVGEPLPTDPCTVVDACARAS